MKAIPHILAKVYSELWLILPARHRAIQESLNLHLAGEPKAFLVESDSQEKPAAPYTMRGSTALISVSGVIGKRLDWMETACGGYDLDALSNALNVAAADPMARNILVDFNTPGGTVTGVREAGDLIASVDAKKPVFSFSETQSTSAGTWLMTQARGIYTTASAQVGSIGVYLALLDRSAQLEEAGIKVNAISAGKYKLAGAPFKPLTAEERAMFQERADRLHAQFKSAVLAKRPDVPADAMEGQVFDGEQAAAIGLTDGVVSSLDQLLRLLN